MKVVNWLLYEIHRWLGIALAIFMFGWFFSGLVIMYSTPTTQSRSQQLAHAEALDVEPGWLSIGDVWARSTEQRTAAALQRKVKTANTQNQPSPTKTEEPVGIADARLVRLGNEPQWLIEDTRGIRFALSAIDGSLLEISPEKAISIAQNWFKAESADTVAKINYLGTVEYPVILRNQDTLRPFHYVSTDDGRELLISSRTGEVLHASTQLDRTLYYAGNWLHLFKPLESLGLGEIRHDVQLWSGFFATVASLTGLIIGWLRWRPGFGGRRTYSEGRTQPYREFWYKWHFWTGLLGGTVALFWALSGYIDTNPWKLFSNGDFTKPELSRFLGTDLPATMRDWQPVSANSPENKPGTVELGWRRLGDEAVLLAYSRDGQRLPYADAIPKFSEKALQNALQRLAGTLSVEETQILVEYDSYYYPRHHQNTTDKPLPVVLAILNDKDNTHIYVDPLDGRLISKFDNSRRLFRWLYSALHHWDFGWLYFRPIWDVWMLIWVSFGLVLGASSIVIGWRRLKKTFVGKKRNAPRSAPATQLATESVD